MFRYVCFDNDDSRGKFSFLQKHKKGIVITNYSIVPLMKSDVNIRKLQKVLTDVNTFKDSLVFFDVEVILFANELGLGVDLLDLLKSLVRLKKKIYFIADDKESVEGRIESIYPTIIGRLSEIGGEIPNFIFYQGGFEREIISILCDEYQLDKKQFEAEMQEETGIEENYFLTNDNLKILFYSPQELQAKNRFATNIALTYPRLLRLLLPRGTSIAVNFLSLYRDDSLLDIKMQYGNAYNLIDSNKEYLKGLTSLDNLDGEGIFYSFSNSLNSGNKETNIVYDIIYGNEEVDLSKYNQIFFHIRTPEEIQQIKEFLYRKKENFKARPMYFTTFFVLNYKRQELALELKNLMKDFQDVRAIIATPLSLEESFGMGHDLTRKKQINKLLEWEFAYNAFIVKEVIEKNDTASNVDEIQYDENTIDFALTK